MPNGLDIREKRIKPEDLKVGMKVAIPVTIQYGWNQRTGLTHFRFREITRITPACRKVYCEEEEYEVKNTLFLLPCEEMEVEDRRASAFAKIARAINAISSPIPFIGTVDKMEKWAELFEQLQNAAKNEEEK